MCQGRPVKALGVLRPAEAHAQEATSQGPARPLQGPQHPDSRQTG